MTTGGLVLKETSMLKKQLLVKWKHYARCLTWRSKLLRLLVLKPSERLPKKCQYLLIVYLSDRNGRQSLVLRSF